jgi:hypothetical protein
MHVLHPTAGGQSPHEYPHSPIVSTVFALPLFVPSVGHEEEAEEIFRSSEQWDDAIPSKHQENRYSLHVE